MVGKIELRDCYEMMLETIFWMMVLRCCIEILVEWCFWMFVLGDWYEISVEWCFGMVFFWDCCEMMVKVWGGVQGYDDDGKMGKAYPNYIPSCNNGNFGLYPIDIGMLHRTHQQPQDSAGPQRPLPFSNDAHLQGLGFSEVNCRKFSDPDYDEIWWILRWVSSEYETPQPVTQPFNIWVFWSFDDTSAVGFLGGSDICMCSCHKMVWCGESPICLEDDLGRDTWQLAWLEAALRNHWDEPMNLDRFVGRIEISWGNFMDLILHYGIVSKACVEVQPLRQFCRRVNGKVRWNAKRPGRFWKPWTSFSCWGLGVWKRCRTVSVSHVIVTSQSDAGGAYGFCQRFRWFSTRITSRVVMPQGWEGWLTKLEEV